MIHSKRYYLWKDSLLCTLLTFIVGGILYLLFVNISILDPFEKAFQDFSFTDIYYAKGFHNKTPTQDIILVNVKHASRFEIAQVIQNVALQEPKVIGLDLVFKDLKEPHADSLLQKTLQHHKHIVTAFYYEQNTIIGNNDYFKNSHTTSGFINLNQEGGQTVIRNFLGATIKKEDTLYNFAVQVAKTSGRFNINRKNFNKLQDLLPINYTTNINSYLTFDYEELLTRKSIPAMKNAIVLFGYLGTPTNNSFDIEDKHFTPLNPEFSGRSVPDMFGVVIHANSIQMLLKDDFIKKAPKFFVYLLAFISCFFVVMLGFKLYKRSEFVFDLVIKIIQLFVSILLLYFALLCLKLNVYLFISPILVLTVLGLEMVNFYVYILKFFKKHFSWKSYVLD